MQDTVLRTSRLNLRSVDEDDLNAVHELHSLPETDRYNTLGIPENIGVTKEILGAWIRENRSVPRMKYFFSVSLNDTKTFIGLAALKLSETKYNNAEIWYKLHRDTWGNGYATEAVKAIIRFGFTDLQLHRLEAGCAVDNIASSKVLEKAGMTLEGRKRLHLPLKSGWSDCFEYGMLTNDPIT